MLLYRLYILILIGCCLAVAGLAQAQTVYNIRGYVCNKNSLNRVAGVTIINKQSKVMVFTNDQGVFAIQASKGDTLEFKKSDFTTAEQVVFGPADMVIALQQSINLSQVDIKGQSTRQALNETMDGYRKNGVYYNGKPSALSMIASPLNGLYEVFGKEPARARRFAAYAKQEQEAAEDDAKYNKDLVKRVTGLPDDELPKFMNAFKPTHEDLQKWTSYELISYIKRSLESYKKYGAPPVLNLK